MKIASRRPVFTSRVTSAAVFCHSQSETALVSSEDSANPMASARTTTLKRHSTENRV